MRACNQTSPFLYITHLKIYDSVDMYLAWTGLTALRDRSRIGVEYQHKALDD